MSSVGKGGHGEVCSVEIPDFVKKKCFGTDCQDIVMKKVFKPPSLSTRGFGTGNQWRLKC